MSWKKSTREYYSSISSGYEELYGEEQLAKVERGLGQLRFEKDDLVLDIGCGTGLASRMICQKVDRIVCVDLSREMMERGRSYGLREFLVCDAENLPFRERVFDKVVSFTVFQNLENPSRMLDEIKRICRGVVVLSVLKKGWSLQMFKELVGDFLTLYEVSELDNDFLCLGRT